MVAIGSSMTQRSLREIIYETILDYDQVQKWPKGPKGKGIFYLIRLSVYEMSLDVVQRTRKVLY